MERDCKVQKVGGEEREEEREVKQSLRYVVLIETFLRQFMAVKRNGEKIVSSTRRTLNHYPNWTSACYMYM